MKHKHGGDVYGTNCRLDFSANVNPLGMPDSVIRAACEGVRRSTAYPDSRQAQLKEAIAAKHGVAVTDVICGNGAAELLFLLCGALRRMGEERSRKAPGRRGGSRTEGAAFRALLVSPGFAEYEQAVRSAGGALTFYPCCEESGFALREDFLDCLGREPDVVFLCSPNNPTGALIDPGLLRRIAEECRRREILLVMDECFVPLTQAGEENSLVPLLAADPYLFVLRAFTKLYGMAGLRLGYGLCRNEELLRTMEEGVQPWNVSLPAQMAGAAALAEEGFEERSRECVAEQKAYLTEALTGLGLRWWPPGANFIFFRGPEDLGERCAARGILIRDCSNYRGLKKGYWRIAVRTGEENERLIRALRQILGK